MSPFSGTFLFSIVALLACVDRGSCAGDEQTCIAANSMLQPSTPVKQTAIQAIPEEEKGLRSALSTRDTSLEQNMKDYMNIAKSAAEVRRDKSGSYDNALADLQNQIMIILEGTQIWWTKFGGQPTSLLSTDSNADDSKKQQIKVHMDINALLKEMMEKAEKALENTMFLVVINEEGSMKKASMLQPSTPVKQTAIQAISEEETGLRSALSTRDTNIEQRMKDYKNFAKSAAEVHRDKSGLTDDVMAAAQEALLTLLKDAMAVPYWFQQQPTSLLSTDSNADDSKKQQIKDMIIFEKELIDAVEKALVDLASLTAFAQGFV